VNFINAVLYQPLFNLLIFLTNILPGHSLGLAIIVITILIRIIMLPSSLKAAHAQVKSTLLQPKISKIRKEIKDQKEQSQALMALYKEEGFSPFGSCLPLIIQFIILIALYNVFRTGLSGSDYSALYSFVQRPEALGTQFLGYNLNTPDPWVLPIIAAVLQVFLSWLMVPKVKVTPETQKDPLTMMNKQMIFLPAIITVYFGHTVPSALVFYWITMTIFSIAQQLYVNKSIRKGKTIEAVPVDVSELLPQKKEKAEVVENKGSKISQIMNKRLDKQEKKADVTVTIRKKK